MGWVLSDIYVHYSNKNTSGRYEIMPLRKAKKYVVGMQQVIDNEWGNKSVGYSSKLLPTHLLLVRYNDESDVDQDGIVIGQVTIGGRLGDPSYSGKTSKWKKKSDPIIWITSLVIHPKYRGNGWGKMLMAAVYKYAIKHEFIEKGIKRIEGQPASKKLIQFYCKLGGNILKNRRKYVENTNIGVNLDDESIKGKAQKIIDKQSDAFNLIISY